MRRTLLVAFLAVMAFTALVAFSFLHESENVARWLAHMFIVEGVLSIVATIYVWRMAWKSKEQSWVLALFATSTLLITLALLPATAFLLAEVTDFDIFGFEHPGNGVGVMLVFAGIVGPLMATTLWWHRNRG